MATEKREIEIALRSKSAEASADKLTGKVKGVGTAADGSERSMFKLSKAAAAVGSALATAAISKFFIDATKAATAFNASMSNLSAITGATGKDLDFLRKAALEFGATTTLSATQAAEALKLVASAKPDLLSNAAALKEVTRQAVLLAEASGGTLQLADAAGVVGKALNQFGADADQAARFVNVLAAGSKFGSSEVLATSEALKAAGVAAASAKVSFEETNAAIQVLAKNGISGAEAGTALRNIFLKLDTDTNSKLRPSVVGLSQALKNLNDLNEDGAAQVKRFGLENIIAGKSLLSSVSTLGDLTTKLTGTNTAFDQASTNVDNLEGDVKALGSAFESLQIQVGSLADGELRELTQSTTQFLQALNGNEGALKEWNGALENAKVIAASVAVIIAGRFVASAYSAAAALTATAAAALKGSVQMNAMGVVVARNTVIMNTGALAARGLSAAMALIGGPVGAAVIAAASIAYFVTQADKAETSADKYAAKVRGLTGDLDGLEQSQNKANIRLRENLKISIASEIEKATKALKEQEALVVDIASSQNPMGFETARLKSEEMRAELEKLKQSLFELESKTSKGNILGDDFISDKAKQDVADLFSGSSGADLFGGGGDASSASTGGSSSGGESGSQGGKDLKFIDRLKLETQQMQAELEVRRQINQGYITEQQGRDALEVQNLLFKYETKRQLILDQEFVTEELRQEALAELREQELAQLQLLEESKTEIKESGDSDRLALEKQYSDQVMAMQFGVASQGIQVLSNFVGQSKTAKIALIALDKGLAIAQTIINSQVAATRALAELGPIAGPPAAAAMLTYGKISAGLIAATGLGQAFASTGGGGGSLGSISTQSSQSPQAQQSPPPSIENQKQEKVINFVGLENFGPDDFIPMTKSSFISYMRQNEDVNIAVNEGQQGARRIGAI